MLDDQQGGGACMGHRLYSALLKRPQHNQCLADKG